MAKKEKMVHCRYPKCSKLHDTTELKESEAVKGGSRSYYHPDCYHIMQTVTQIRCISSGNKFGNDWSTGCAISFDS